MNYLAHAYLAKETSEMLVGGMMGDFVKGRVTEELPSPVRHGIIMHRRIDRFTDDHFCVAASKKLVSPSRRRFAGIMVDVFYDHFLARHWHQFSDQSLADFTSSVYDTLYQHWNILPARLRSILPVMSDQDWLASYRHIDAMHRSLNGISVRRLKRSNTLYQGAVELERHYTEFENHFLEFFPDLVSFTEK